MSGVECCCLVWIALLSGIVCHGWLGLLRIMLVSDVSGVAMKVWLVLMLGLDIAIVRCRVLLSDVECYCPGVQCCCQVWIVLSGVECCCQVWIVLLLDVCSTSSATSVFLLVAVRCMQCDTCLCLSGACRTTPVCVCRGM